MEDTSMYTGDQMAAPAKEKYARTPQDLDNSIDYGVPEGESEMAHNFKAKVGEHWITAASLQELADKAIAMSVQLAAQEKDQKTLRVSDYCVQFLKIYKSGAEANTIVGYRGYLKNHIFPFMGDMAITDVTSETVQRFINEKAKTLSRKTTRKIIELMRQVFDAAVEDDLVTKNAFRSKKLKIYGLPTKPVKAYTEDEYRQITELIVALDPIDAMYVALTVYTGMREGEICALATDDIDFDELVIRVKGSVTWKSVDGEKVHHNIPTLKETKTENGIRDVIMLPQLEAVLREKIGACRGRFIISGPRSDASMPATHEVMTRMRQRINRTAKALGLSVQFGNRRGRHTVATFMNNAGLDDKTIEGQIGHYDANFTRRRCMNPQMEQMRSGMAKLSDYMQSISR